MNISFGIKSSLAAALVVISVVPVASAASAINFNLANLRSSLSSGSVASETFDLNLEDIAASTATAALDLAAGVSIPVTDLEGTISVVSGVVAGGSFSFTSGDDIYSALIRAGSGLSLIHI